MSERNKTLKEALYNTVHRSDLSVAVIAEEIGMSESYLYRACLPEEEDGGSGSGTKFPMKKIIPLTRATEDFQLLDSIEQSLGRVAVDVPRRSTISCGQLADQAVEAAAEFGTLMQAVQAAAADPEEVSPEDRAYVIKMGWAAIRAIAGLTTACEKEQERWIR